MASASSWILYAFLLFSVQSSIPMLWALLIGLLGSDSHCVILYFQILLEDSKKVGQGRFSCT